MLIFGLILFLRLGFTNAGRNFLQLNLNRFVYSKLNRTPSLKELAFWQGINREAQDAVFIFTGLVTLSLTFLK